MTETYGTCVTLVDGIACGEVAIDIIGPWPHCKKHSDEIWQGYFQSFRDNPPLCQMCDDRPATVLYGPWHYCDECVAKVLEARANNN